MTVTEWLLDSDPSIRWARLRGQEYLLERRMIRRLSTGEVVDPAWTLFSFPTRWHYDVLRGLDYLRSAGPGPGQDVVFTAEFVNLGTGAAAPFNVQVEVDGVPLRVFSVTDLTPGAARSVDFAGWSSRVGTHTLRAVADVAAHIAEPDEEDNTLERVFVIGEEALGLPDLHILGVRLDPPVPRAGQTVEFVAEVQNTGGNVLDAFALDFSVDGASVGQVVVPGLPAGEVAQVRSPAWLARRPSHHLRVGVDVAGVVAEKDEANNEYTRRFRVRLRGGRAGS